MPILAHSFSVYFFVEAGKNLDSNPLTNVIVFDGTYAYIYGSGSFPNNVLRNNDTYFEDLYAYEGYVESQYPSGAGPHFVTKYTLDHTRSNSTYDYYQDNKGYPIRVAKDKSHMKKGPAGTWRFNSVDKHTIIRTFDKSERGQTNIYGAGYNGNNGGYHNGSSNSNLGSNSNVNTPARKFKCAYCNGTGRIEKNDNAPANFGTDRPKQRCNECGKWYDPDVFTHYHQQCSQCGGTGYAK